MSTSRRRRLGDSEHISTSHPQRRDNVGAATTRPQSQLSSPFSSSCRSPTHSVWSNLRPGNRTPPALAICVGIQIAAEQPHIAGCPAGNWMPGRWLDVRAVGWMFGPVAGWSALTRASQLTGPGVDLLEQRTVDQDLDSSTEIPLDDIAGHRLTDGPFGRNQAGRGGTGKDCPSRFHRPTSHRACSRDDMSVRCRLGMVGAGRPSRSPSGPLSLAPLPIAACRGSGPDTRTYPFSCRMERVYSFTCG